MKLLKKAMVKSGGSKFLIDGFPRNFDNLEGWHRVVGDEAEVQGVLMFECPEEVMEARLLERGKTSGRTDDQIDTIRKRFKTYLQSTVPVIEHYAAQGKTYRINGHQPVERVTADTHAVIVPLVKAELLRANALLVAATQVGRWDLFEALADPAVSALSPASKNELVLGTPFHKYTLESNARAVAAAAAAAAATGALAPVPPEVRCSGAFFARSATLVTHSTHICIHNHLQVTLAAPHVRLLHGGKVGVVSGNLLVQSGSGTAAFGQTTVWQLQSGRWRLVHSHTSAA